MDILFLIYFFFVFVHTKIKMEHTFSWILILYATLLTKNVREYNNSSFNLRLD